MHGSAQDTDMENTNAPKTLSLGYTYEIAFTDGSTVTAKITNRSGRVYRVKVDGSLRTITLNHVATATRLD
jgi:hypothetical protein